MAEEILDDSNIVDSSTNFNEILFKDDDSRNGKMLLEKIRILAKNDETIAGNFKYVPGVWFCKWYDNEIEKGYNKGDFFWVNTENVENFIRDNNQRIMELANKSPFVRKKLPKWKNNDSEIFRMYYNALTGYVDDNVSKALPPIYYIGEISNDFQIIISQKDNNKDVPETVEALESWKKFAVNTKEDYERIRLVTTNNMISAMTRHVDDYHGGGNEPSKRIVNNLSNYANEDFSNVDFSFTKNYIKNNFYTRGMDCVEMYVKKPFSNRRVGNYSIEHVWFRKWKSGYLEHGGIIDVRKYLNFYGDLITIPFDWKVLDSGSKFYQIDYLGTNDGNAIEVDESHQIPPGDNLISVLHELDNLIIDKTEVKNAPIYYSNDYTVSLVPIQQQFDNENEIGNVESYVGLGNHSVKENVLNAIVYPDYCKKEGFSFKYDPNTTPNYYSYYVTGFCI